MLYEIIGGKDIFLKSYSLYSYNKGQMYIFTTRFVCIAIPLNGCHTSCAGAGSTTACNSSTFGAMSLHPDISQKFNSH